MSRLSRLAAAALAGLLAGCVLDEVDLEGKSCPCAPGFECDVDTRSCRPVGGAGATDAGAGPDAGPPDMGAPVACVTDRDCGDPPNRVCVEGFCAPGCEAGGSCEAPASCDAASGHCLVSGACAGDADCAPPRSVCLAGQCAAGCTVSTGVCGLDRVCEPATGHCAPGPSCAGGETCPISHFCDGASCRQRCTEPGAPFCAGNSMCNPDSGQCQGGLALGVECDADIGCASGRCLSVRRGGEIIPQRFCSRPCGADADCPLGMGCVPVSGAGQCIPNRVLGGGADARSLRSGETCDPATNRCQSLFCESSRCVERCSRDRDCRAFEGAACVAATQTINGSPVIIPRCLPPFVGGAPGDSCQSDGECAGGLCDPDLSTCARLCCAERDCPGDAACVPLQASGATVRVCRPRSGSGTREVGAPCDGDADCRSQTCGPANAGNPQGPQICTTYCCTDADCAALPGGGRCETSPGPFSGVALGRCVR